MSTYWKTKDVCEYLGISMATCHLWRKTGKLPYRKFGGKTFRYDPNEIQSFADRCKVNSRG